MNPVGPGREPVLYYTIEKKEDSQTGNLSIYSHSVEQRGRGKGDNTPLPLPDQMKSFTLL